MAYFTLEVQFCNPLGWEVVVVVGGGGASIFRRMFYFSPIMLWIFLLHGVQHWMFLLFVCWLVCNDGDMSRGNRSLAVVAGSLCWRGSGKGRPEAPFIFNDCWISAHIRFAYPDVKSLKMQFFCFVYAVTNSKLLLTGWRGGTRRHFALSEVTLMHFCVCVCVFSVGNSNLTCFLAF